MLWIKHDREIDALYIKIDPERTDPVHHRPTVARTEIVYQSEGRFVNFDWDENGDLLGIEVI